MKEHELALVQWLAVPRDFLHGFSGGLLAPVLALAGAVGLLYVVTKKLPAIKEVTRDSGATHRALVLTPPLQARASWAKYGGELRSLILEAQAQQTEEA